MLQRLSETNRFHPKECLYYSDIYLSYESLDWQSYRINPERYVDCHLFCFECIMCEEMETIKVDIMNEKAKQFFMDLWGDKSNAVHADALIRTCADLINETELDKTVFVIAAWLHDLGKVKDIENHSFESMNFLDVFIQQNPEANKWYNEVADCILHHESKSTPDTVYGKIFQFANIKSREHPIWLDFVKTGQ